MRVVHAPEEMRTLANEARGRGETVGLVPTMGALHQGHATLVREAATRSRHVIVTVFVNPTQFAPTEDLAKYPRTLDADVALAAAAGAQTVFAPNEAAMYPPGDETRVHAAATARHLEGAFRPTHFEGVATIVTKLLALAGPSIACFGKKDYQQLQIIKRLVADLFLPIEIVTVPTVREPDGLALSSRNRYLDAGARERARRIPEGLSLAHASFARGERRVDALSGLVRARLEGAADAIDYVAVADAATVTPFDGVAPARAVLAVAARVGGARLIDNVVLGEDPAPIPGFDRGAT
jgi:pantoate--beta-alanine ligase